MPSVSIILPQHGQCRLTLQALQTLLQHHADCPGLELLVVDDGSPPAERRWLLERLPPSVRMVPCLSRRGVTAAWNAGLQHSEGAVAIFLNNDTLTRGSWIPQLVTAVQIRPLSVVGCEWRHDADAPGRGRRGRRLLSGWCLGMDRSTLLDWGGFDERLRLYFSDTDLQLRCEAAGGELVRVDDLPLTHLGHQSTRQLGSRTAEWRRDRLRFLKKWRGQS